MTAYYNENDPFAAAWLRNLISKHLIAYGEVDERSIKDVLRSDLYGFTQCHFFAGIGGWSHALRLAGWPDDKPVWTGSCPCQPFSAAGKRAGTVDERHLWPSWFHLIEQCRPGVIFAEQVEAAIRFGWIDLVHDDLEGICYAVGKAGLAASSVKAPHIRQRLWWVGKRMDYTTGARCDRKITESERKAWDETWVRLSGTGSKDGFLANSQRQGLEVIGEQSARQEQQATKRSGALSEFGIIPCFEQLADAIGDERGQIGANATGCGEGSAKEGLEQRPYNGGMRGVEYAKSEQVGIPGFTRQPGNAVWDDCEWVPCIDWKCRPVEPGTFPLAHGIPARVGRLRGYGNAIVPQVAAEFITSFMSLEA